MSIRDRALGASKTAASKSAFLVLDAVQELPPEHQILGSALFFLCYCKRYDIDPRDMLCVASAVFREGLTDNNHHILALKHFMKVDIKDPYSFVF